MIGIDEVGRGSLIGDVYACACFFDSNVVDIKDIKDSKKLTSKKREIIYEAVLDRHDIKFAIGIATKEEIEQINILNASLLAMERAFIALNIIDVKVLIDGNFKPQALSFAECVVGGDDIFPQISLASIIAKVVRDKNMIDIAKEIPQYNIENNKGYGTKQHFEAIKMHGLTKFHRRNINYKLD